MKRILSIALLVIIAGCANAPVDNTITTETTAIKSATEITTTEVTTTEVTINNSTKSGLIRTKPVQFIPNNTSIANLSDEEIRCPRLKESMKKAILTNSTVYRHVAGEEFSCVDKLLNKLEPYGDADPNVEDGYYIKFNNSIVVVTLRVEL